jgi:probable rRNA maturation factor
MIQLDPDLDPSFLPLKASDRRQQRSASNDESGRLPVQATLTRFLNEARKAVRLRGEVSVMLTTDPAIKQLNKQFRGKNKATDVLSFPADNSFPGISGEDLLAGDLAISVPTAARQAAEQGHDLKSEIKILLLHGLLHLNGMDHETDNGEMAKREVRLRKSLKLPLGLIERAGAAAAPAKKQPAKRTAAKKSTSASAKKTATPAKKAVARKPVSVAKKAVAKKSVAKKSASKATRATR